LVLKLEKTCRDGEGTGEHGKKQNSKKAWGVGGRQLQTLKNRVGHAGVKTEMERKREEKCATIYLLNNSKHI